jgi:hypothetical protein
VFLTTYYLDDQIKKNEMGGTCSMCLERSGTYRVWWVSLKKRDQLEDLAVDVRVILKWMLNKYDGFRPG